MEWIKIQKLEHLRTERNFSMKQKNSQLCLRWHILRSYRFVADVTFKFYGISGQICGLIHSFLSNRGLPVVLDRKDSQEYAVNAGVPQGPILGPTLFLLYINDFFDDVICNIAIYADDTTLYSLSVIRHLICGTN